MKVSVIIPLYNKENYIATTLNSILSQTFTDFEIIIVNDGSNDNSPNVVKSFNDCRIKLYEQANHGVSAARNKGISIAKGEYIAFIDADDKWAPNYLANMTSLAEKYSDYSVFCSAQIGRPIKTLPNGISIIEDHCKFDYIFWTGCMLIKKEVFEKVGGFREGVQLGEDRDMWLRIACKYHTIYLNEELAYHPYETENNLTRIIDTAKSFPYWEWYGYPYPNKESLYKYATRLILRCGEELSEQKRYSEAWYYLYKIKGIYSILPRIALLLKIIFRK